MGLPVMAAAFLGKGTGDAADIVKNSDGFITNLYKPEEMKNERT